MSRHFQTIQSKRHHIGSSVIRCLLPLFSCGEPAVVVLFAHCHGRIVYRDEFHSVLDRMVDVWAKKKTFCAILCSMFEQFPSIFQHCNPAKLFVLTSNSTRTCRRADTASRLPLIITIFSPSPLNSFSFSSTITESHYKVFFLPASNFGETKSQTPAARGRFFFLLSSS